MKQAVDCDVFLYADDSCLVYQHRDVKEIERNINENFSDVCDRFVDNKLSIRLGEDKTKCTLFGTKHRLNKVSSLNIKYGEMHIKQCHTVTYLGCLLDETLSGESMASKVISKINSRLRILYRKIRFLCLPLCRLLCNGLIQPHFDYACSAWYPNLKKRLKSELQILQIKSLRFCLNLNNRAHIGRNEFEQINWLPVNDRFKQFISSVSFKFCNNTSPPYMNDVFEPAGQPNATARASLLKLNQPLRRINHSQNISYIAPIIWNNLPNSLKTTDNLNTYKHISLLLISFFLMHNHFSFLLLLFLLLLLLLLLLVVAVAVTVLAGALSLSLLLSVVVALIKFQYHYINLYF